ncbi:hypothetical protein AL345_13575 [Aeromonas caviae]|nr:hypothetical protein AL345_13575 [Aeromonas caviae]
MGNPPPVTRSAKVGEDVNQTPEQIAGAVRQRGQCLATRQIQQGDAVVPISPAVFGQGKQLPVRVQGPGGELVIPLGRLAGSQPLSGSVIGVAALPQAAVRLHAPLAASLAQPVVRHWFAPLPALPLRLQALHQWRLAGELLFGPAVLLAQQRQEDGILAAVVTPATIGIETGYLPLHQLRALGDEGRGLQGCLRQGGGGGQRGQQAGQDQ